MRMPGVELDNSALPPINRDGRSVSHLTAYYQRPFHRPPSGAFRKAPRPPQQPRVVGISSQKRYWSGPDKFLQPEDLLFNTVLVPKPHSAVVSPTGEHANEERVSSGKVLSQKLQRIVEKYNKDTLSDFGLKDDSSNGLPVDKKIRGKNRKVGPKSKISSNDLAKGITQIESISSQNGISSPEKSETVRHMPEYIGSNFSSETIFDNSDTPDMVETSQGAQFQGQYANSPQSQEEQYTFAQRVAARRQRQGNGRTASTSSNIMTDPLGAGPASNLKGKLRKLKSLYPQQSSIGPNLNQYVWTVKEEEEMKKPPTKKGPIKKMTIGGFGLSNSTKKQKIQDSNLQLLYEKGIFHEHLVNVRASIDRAKSSLGNSGGTPGGGILNPPPSAASIHNPADNIHFIHGREHHQWSNPAVPRVCHITPLVLPEQAISSGNPQRNASSRAWTAEDTMFGAHLPRVVGHTAVPQDENDEDTRAEKTEHVTKGTLLGLSDMAPLELPQTPRKSFPAYRNSQIIKNTPQKYHRKTKFSYNVQDVLSRENTNASGFTDQGVSYITPRLEKFDLDDFDEDYVMNSNARFGRSLKKSTRVPPQKKTPQSKLVTGLQAITNMHKSVLKSLIGSIDHNSEEDDVEVLVPPCSPQSSIYDPERYSPKPTYKTLDGAFLVNRNGSRMHSTWKA